jgi:hypothetical protein
VLLLRLQQKAFLPEYYKFCLRSTCKIRNRLAPVGGNLAGVNKEDDPMPHDYLPARIALVLNGLGMMILYPLNMVVLERASWIWDYPDRNLAMEHMLVAVYLTMGAFLVWSARDPIKALPLIDFVIVSGAIHATAMAFDAAHMPGMSHHLAFRGDVIGTYLAPITLALTHPRRFYLFQWNSA